MATNYWGEELATFLLNGIELASGLKIAEVFSNPSAGAGYSAPIGSFAIHNSVWYKKTSGTDTGWTVVPDQDAIDSLTTLINDHITDTTDAHDATAISSTNTLGANVELVLTALKNYKDLGLQSAYNEYSDITVDAVNPIKIKNIAGDTQTYPLQVRSNDEGDIYFAAGKDNTFMKNVTFSSDPTKKIELTTNGNIKTTDSLGTNLFRKDFNELYVEDFKENLPSAVLTASNAAITVNDATNANYLSNTITTFTQSSALTGYYVESDAIAITNNNKWLLEPIKIQSMQGTSGGAGTWDFRIFTSTDGVSYADKKVAVQLGDLKNDKIITQLDSDVTHVKLRWTIVNPDNATTLTLGGFIITSDAFPVGQTVLFGVGNFAYTSTLAGDILNFDTPVGTDEITGKFLTYNASTGLWTAIKKQKLIVDITMNGSTAADIPIKLNGTTVHQTLSMGASLASVYRTNGGWKFSLNVGDTVQFGGGGIGTVTTGGASNFAKVSFEATAYADNVMVDAATFNADSYLRYSGSTLQPVAPMVDFSGLQQSHGTAITADANNREFTINESGIYSINVSVTSTTLGGILTITKNYTGTDSANVNTIGVGENQQGNGYLITANFTGHLNETDKVRIICPTLSSTPNSKLSISKIATPPAFVQLDVSNERENEYTAIIDTSGNIEYQSPTFLTSANGTTGTGRRTLVWPDGFFGSNANAISVSATILDNDGNVSSITASNITTSGCRIFTEISNAAAFRRFSVTVKALGAGYKAQKAFVANAVSIDNIITDGQEHKLLGKKHNGKDIYYTGYSWSGSSSTDVPLGNIGASMELVDIESAIRRNDWKVRTQYPLSSTNYWFPEYNYSTGATAILVGAETIVWARVVFYYTKP